MAAKAASLARRRAAKARRRWRAGSETRGDSRSVQCRASASTVGYVAADRAFHHTIVAAAGNAILTRISGSLRDRQRRMVAATVARDPELPRRFVEEHRAILGAIERGEADDAARLVEEHLARSRDRIERAGR